MKDAKPMLLIRTDLCGLIDVLRQMNSEHDAEIAALPPGKAYARGYYAGRSKQATRTLQRKAGAPMDRQNAHLRRMS